MESCVTAFLCRRLPTVLTAPLSRNFARRKNASSRASSLHETQGKAKYADRRARATGHWQAEIPAALDLIHARGEISSSRFGPVRCPQVSSHYVSSSSSRGCLFQ